MLAVAMLAAALAPPETPVAVDAAALKKLQGTWQLTGQEHGGKKAEMKDLADTTLEVNRTAFTSRDGIDIKEDSRVSRLDPRAKPAAIDLTIVAGPDIDKVVQGVWKLEGDTLTICVAEPGKERPKAFAGKEGTGHTLLVFRRARK